MRVRLSSTVLHKTRAVIDDPGSMLMPAGPKRRFAAVQRNARHWEQSRHVTDRPETSRLTRTEVAEKPNSHGSEATPLCFSVRSSLLQLRKLLAQTAILIYDASSSSAAATGVEAAAAGMEAAATSRETAAAENSFMPRPVCRDRMSRRSCC